MIPDLLEIPALLAAMREGRLTAAALAEALLDRIESYSDKAVFITLRPRAEILAEAKAVDPTLPLAGMLFAVKDNIDVAGLATTASCPDFAYRPAKDATVVARLRAAGAIPVGKANLDQFATGLNGTRSPYGAPRSVFHRDYVAGGSSSGSAVAVAAGLVVFALGTDTAGSGRVPAAFNNLIGLKPSRGRIPATGVVPACQSLDCVSILANSAADAAAILSVVEGVDGADPYSRAAAEWPLPSLPRTGFLRPSARDFAGDIASERRYDAALEAAESLGWRLVEIDYEPFAAIAALLYDDAFVAERLAAIRPFFADHADCLDPSVRTILEGAQRFDAADAFTAQTRLQALKQRVRPELAKTDVLLLPTTPTIFSVAEIAEQPITRNAVLGRYSNFVNLLDLAAVALPAGFRPDGLPAGVTLVGPAFSDHALLTLADRLHNSLSPGIGIKNTAPQSRLRFAPEDRILLVVAGAHLSGMALNHELTSLGARLEAAVRTAPDYRLYALDTDPPKPGLTRDPGFNGPGIAVELWSLAPEALARFVAALPSPMGLGKVTLADGTSHPGFLCEAHALKDAEEITVFGGWRAYRAVAAAP